MFTPASHSKTIVMFLYLPQTRCHAPAKVHQPLQLALGPPLAATVPTCNTQTISSQCSMLLWSRCPLPLSVPNPAPHRVAGSATAAKCSFAGLLTGNLPRVFLFQAVWVKQKLNASAEGELHRDTGLSVTSVVLRIIQCASLCV